MSTSARLCLAAAMIAVAAPAAGQAPGPRAQPTVASCENKRTALGAAQTVGVNLVINRFNAWALGEDFANVDFRSWSHNLYRGWKWDANQFTVNMFLHPYHGALYYGGSRASCLDFWESIPIVFLGSWMWEFFGETHRASLNDFYMTGFGGVALGEIMHRAAGAVLDEEARGGGRIARELAALAINPVGGLNRLVRGQWTRRGVNPEGRLPDSYLVGAKLGGRRVEESGSPPRGTTSPTVLLDVAWGDAFDTEYSGPFDVFDVRAQVSPDGGGLNMLRAVGRLYSKEVTNVSSWHRHQVVISQRFDFVNNPVYNFGQQSLEAAILSRWRSGPRGLRLKTRLAAEAVVLGAIDALEAGFGERTIDWGPGLGAIAEVVIEYNGTTYLSFYNRARYLRSVSGAPAEHTLLFSGFDFTIPITSQLGIGAYVSGDRRYSDYSELPNDERSYEETRIYLTWTLGSGRPEGAR
ncbi:MAG TPA: DUF3943 domain-containing protein [Longimicrobiales bacterium]|nr:DUF3943 domain-containing protein [Longimicrobiales bacterium]